MIFKILYVLNGILLFFGLCLLSTLFILRQYIKSKKARLELRNPIVNVGIFHPYCNAGGGGERVLWCAVRSIQAKYDNVRLIIYTGDMESSPSRILDKVKHVFNINLENDSIKFVYLKFRYLVEAKRYPVFTLLGQSIGSMILGLEALVRSPPDIYLDTMGYAFTLPLFRFIGCCKVGCYVHYPTISTDMLRRVQKRQYSHNNQSYVIRNPFLTRLKVTYYKLFARIYRWVGKSSETVMVNSSWTENHILDIWDVPFKTHRVYPPCEVNYIKSLQRCDNHNEIIILSVGQYRPEKDHPLQLQVMYELRTLLIHNEELWNKIKLIVVGSCRDESDHALLKNMEDLAKHLSLENNVDFKVNVPYHELLELYKKADIGLHTMWNEHFGISVVECMAAGIIMVAHKSGGPLLDIIETSKGSQNGFLATDGIEYANCILTVIYNSKEDNDRIRKSARSAVERFSEKEFEVNFLRAITPLFNKDIKK